MKYLKKNLITLTLILFMMSLMPIRAFAEESGTKVILIDPGHGGMDGGATSKNGTNEKDINLSISLFLKEELEQMGYKVVMTREEDRGLYSENGTVRQKKIEDLNKRCKIKSESNCDLFISIHVDKFEEAKYCGTQVWYSNYPDSEVLANIIHKNIKTDVNPDNKRNPKAAKEAYKVLRCNDKMPSIIIECGFISNPEDEKKLLDLDYQKKLSGSFGKSIDEFFKNIEKKD